LTPLIGFAPDADPTTPGLLIDCANLVPNLNGMEGAPTLSTPSGVPVLSESSLGSSIVTKLDGSRRIFSGGQTKIYELVGGVWTDRSRGGGYTGSNESYWSVAQFGDATLMSNGADTMQRSTLGAFADIAGAPKAQIVFSVGSFVMALNTDSYTDQWHCCAAFDDTSWTESITTQAASGRLVSQPGPITAGARLGEYAIAYKAKSIYLGQYVGAPAVWDWVQVRGGNAGCIGKNAICDINGAHFFVGEDNFWMFDGTAPQPLADGVLRKWFATNCNPAIKYKTFCAFDKTTNLVWIFYPSTSSTTLDSALVYHVISKRWGRVTVNVESVFEYVSAAMTIDGLDSLAATIDTLPDVPFDSPYWLYGGRTLAVVNTSHQVQSFSGLTDTSSMTTWNAGDDYTFSCLQRVKLRFTTKPTTATLQSYYKNNSGDDWTIGQSVTMTDSKFDLLESARWHKALITFSGPVAITAMDAVAEQDGEE
jgi:hypothetical protein